MKVDIAIIGGGPAGASCAALLASAGRQVLLFERSAGPTDKVCGDFLSPEAVQSLSTLGIDIASLGALPISRVGLAAGRQEASTHLPFLGHSLSRRVLDERLLGEAVRQGAHVKRGQSILSATKFVEGWELRLRDGNRFMADNVVLATGKHDLRGFPRPKLPSALIGLKMHYRFPARQAASMRQETTLALFDGGYAGIQLNTARTGNLCLVVPATRFAALGHNWDALVRSLSFEIPAFGRRFDGAEPLWATPIAVANIPYGFLLREEYEAFWRIGDQAAVIPSFSGDGVAIALHSAARAASMIIGNRPSIAYVAQLRHDLTGQIRHANWIAQVASYGVLQPTWVKAISLAPWLVRSIATRTRVSEKGHRHSYSWCGRTQHRNTSQG